MKDSVSMGIEQKDGEDVVEDEELGLDCFRRGEGSRDLRKISGG